MILDSSAVVAVLRRDVQKERGRTAISGLASDFVRGLRTAAPVAGREAAR